MKGINTSSALAFLHKYDTNKDGLTHQELQTGAIDTFNNIIGSIQSGQGNIQDVMDSFKQFVFAMEVNKSFDSFSQASKAFLPSDNPNTVSGLDILKVASNDGNLYNITASDIDKEKNPVRICQQQTPNTNPQTQNTNYFSPVPGGTQPYPTCYSFTGAKNSNYNPDSKTTFVYSEAPVNCFFG